MKTIRIALGFLFVCVSLSSIAFADELIVNGGFETGSFTGWTVTATTGDYYGLDSYGYSHSGLHYAYFGPIYDPVYISQFVATVPGASYDLSGWLLSEPNLIGTNEIDNFFKVWWDGVLIVNIVNEDQAFPYTQGNFPGLIASTSSTEVILGFWNPPGVWLMDDISVTSAIPEPTSLLLLGAGLGALGLAAYRRKRK